MDKNYTDLTRRISNNPEGAAGRRWCMPPRPWRPMSSSSSNWTRQP